MIVNSDSAWWGRALRMLSQGICLLALAGAAGAQQATLEEVVVTATKREQSLQDVSLSVTALTGDAIDAFAVKRFEDLDMPAVSIGQGGANDALFIRGVGSGFNPGFDQSAPLFIDGTWYGQATSQRLAFLDVDRIEILKGPQPTYLGKNAIAGAFSVVSRRPTNDLAVGVDASYEFEAKERSLFGVVSGPIGSGLRGRLAVKSSEMDGYMRNLGTNEDNPGRQDLAGRLSVQWDVGESLELYAKYEYLSYEEDSRSTQLLRCLPTAPIVPAVEDCKFDLKRAVSFDPAAYHPANDPFFDYEHGGPEYQDLELNGGQIQATWRAGAATVTAVTSYYQQDGDFFTKPDHNVLQRFAQEGTNIARLLSQEVRATSTGDGALQWLAGAYYDDQHLDADVLFVLPSMAGMAGENGYEQDATTKSLFAEISYRVSETLTGKLGGRYSDIEKKSNAYALNYRSIPSGITFLGPRFPFPLNFRYDDTSFEPAVTFEWRPVPGRLFFASWRKGFKAGGIDLNLEGVDPDDFVFRPEEVKYYELGGRMESLAGAARFNVTLFRGNYDDMQVTQLNSETNSFRTLNAAAVVSQGVELDAAWAVSDNLTLSAAVTYLDSTYDSFPGAQCWQFPAQSAAEGCVQIGTTGAGVAIFGQDLSGARTSFAPQWSGSIGVDFQRVLGVSWFGSPVRFLGGIDLFFTDRFSTNFDADPLTAQSGYYKLAARLGLGAEDGTWSATLIGRNLNDELTSHWIANAPAAGNSKFAQTDRPRELAVQLQYRF